MRAQAKFGMLTHEDMGMRWDVVRIGGGSAGSTVAQLLGGWGHAVMRWGRGQVPSGRKACRRASVGYCVWWTWRGGVGWAGAAGGESGVLGGRLGGPNWPNYRRPVGDRFTRRWITWPTCSPALRFAASRSSLSAIKIPGGTSLCERLPAFAHDRKRDRTLRGFPHPPALI